MNNPGLGRESHGSDAWKILGVRLVPQAEPLLNVAPEEFVRAGGAKLRLTVT